jgi:D-glycero-alpha-D-manno-heptose-7-phosphate kinase
MSRAVAMRAPTRVDFGGGWTDVPPYSEIEGGAVCAVAIARYATAALTDAAPGSATAGSVPGPDAPLVRAAIARANVRDAALRVRLHSDFPVGAGLGGSSAASAALLGALDRWRGIPIDRVAIAERGRRIEVEDLGVAGGRQDHYCATHGGLLGLTFGSTVGVRRIPLPAPLRESLERRCVLVYTGESRISGDTISGVLDGYRRGDRGVTFALARMRELAQQMVATLERADVDALGTLVGEHWTHQRALHPAISTARIDAIVERAARAGALGSKATGASGGGCVVAIARDGLEDEVRRAVGALGELIPFTLDDMGLTECDWNAETP